MKENCEKLLSVGGNTLLNNPPIFNQTILDLAGNLGQELQSLLARKNGFYCFESALHIFPSGTSKNTMSLEKWNSYELWKKYYDLPTEKCLFFAEDIFGGQFCILENMICSFDPETGDMEAIAPDIESWAKSILDEYDYFTGFSLANEWQKRNGAIHPGIRLLPRIPFVCGGEFNVGNLYPLDSTEGMILRADIAQQIRKLPDGTTAVLKIVD